MVSGLISTNEIKEAFSSLKLNKSCGYDRISFSVIKNYFDAVCEPLKPLLAKGSYQMI